MPRAVLILAWLSASSGCLVVDDPNHCWNLERDATCEELYPGSVCSSCARGYSGCVEPDEQTPASCLDSDEEATQPSSSAAETAGESGASECVGEGFTDACPTEAPYCAAGLCTGCQAAGGDDFCAAVDTALPQCHPTWDHCVECFDDTPCTGGSVCTTSFECGGCTEHEQCPDSACDLLTGACMQPDREIWVDDDAAICDEGSNGASAGNPVCSLVEAFTRVAPDESAIIRVADGSYDGVDVANGCGGRHIAVLGSGAATVMHDGDGGVPPLGVSCDDAIFVRNMLLHANSAATVNCEAGGTVWIDASIVEAGYPGIHAESCDVSISRSHLREHQFHAIEIYAGARLSMWSSIVSGTTQDGAPTGAVTVSSSHAEIRSSTIADNQGHDLGCAGTYSGTVSDSIASSIVCPSLEVDHSVVGTSDVNGSDNQALEYRAQWFVDPEGGDFRLGDDAAELAGIGRWDAGDPRVDFEGEAWPDVPGTAVYAGADQP